MNRDRRSHSPGSPPSSPPPRKRQRLSSPTYDSMFDMSQEVIDAIECDPAINSSFPSPSKSSQFLYGSQAGKYEGKLAASIGLKNIETADEGDDSFDAPGSPTAEVARRKESREEGRDCVKTAPQSSNPFAQNSSPPGLGGSTFLSALKASGGNAEPPLDAPDPSPNAPQDRELDSWFSSSIPADAKGFASASLLIRETDDDWFRPSSKLTGFGGFKSASRMSPEHDLTQPAETNHEIPVFVGFRSASGLNSKGSSSSDGLLAPSAAALKAAEEKMKKWQQEIDMEVSSVMPQQDEDLPSVSMEPSGRISLGVDENLPVSTLPHQPETPTPLGSGFKRPHVSNAIAGPSRHPKAFKSPLLVPPKPKEAHTPNSVATGYVPSLLNPNRVNESRISPAFPSVKASSMTTPTRPLVTSPKKTLGVTPRRVGQSGGIKSKFITPFKPGMKPGEPGRVQLSPSKPVSDNAAGSSKVVLCTPQRRKVSGDPSTRKIPLSESGLMPQSHSPRRLRSCGINPDDLSQVTPETALYYSFYSTSSTPVTLSQIPPMAVALGHEAAYNQLKEEGCKLATPEWVENHWCMILWKLAGMVLLDPKREADPDKKRWCWNEVMKQLRYRYERELNGVSRPALRLITTQDAPSTSPMVLCVSNIFYGSSSIPQEIEVTDGWYRLRAEIDEPLSRAIERDLIRVGRKLGMSGIRTNNDRNNACEVLDAYDSVSLKLNGNSCHLAPWHAKLGFQKDPFIATLRSLTPDGGPVPVLDIVVTKVHNFGFLEYQKDEEGNRIQNHPTQMKEELAARDKWTRKRDAETAKLRAEFMKEIDRYEGYVEQLDRKLLRHFAPSIHESPPDRIDNYLMDLEDPEKAKETVRKVLPYEAGWLIQAIREKCAKDRDTMNETIERDLDDICPPRDVRSFRVIEARDYRSENRPSNRKVQLTVWNAAGLILEEGSEAGHFVPDQRFMVTNLFPTHKGSWGRPDDDCSVFLSTRRDSRWTRLPNLQH